MSRPESDIRAATATQSLAAEAAPLEDSTRPTAFFADIEPGRKGEILDSALHVFAERGYDGGSMREIAKRVGVTEPAIYRHFPGKEALFLTLIEVGAGRMRHEAFALIGELRPETLRSQLVSLFDNRRRALHLNAPMLRAVVPAAARNAAFLDAFRSAIAAPVLSRLTQKAVELDGAFSVVDADATRNARVRALLSLIVGSFVSSMVLGDRPDEAVANAALKVMGWESRT